jgi:hypothetical protein
MKKQGQQESEDREEEEDLESEDSDPRHKKNSKPKKNSSVTAKSVVTSKRHVVDVQKTFEKYAARIQRENTREHFLALSGVFLCDYNLNNKNYFCENARNAKSSCAISGLNACCLVSHHASILIALVALHGGSVLGVVTANKPRSKKEENEVLHTMMPSPVLRSSSSSNELTYTRGNAPVVYVGSENARSKREESRWALKAEDMVHVSH